MAVDYDMFYDWCVDRFGEHNLKVRNTAHGTEICTHSLWSMQKIGKEDRKFHLWMNVEGGKKRIEGGAFRDWLIDGQDGMGSLVSLVAEVDGIPYEEAEELITGVTSLRSLEKKVHEFFGCKSEIDNLLQGEISVPTEDLVLPEFCFLLDKMSRSHYMGVRARRYLAKRKIPTEDLYVCTGGDYENRIIIPYYDRDDNLVFYNGRIMSDHKSDLRYMKPPEGDQESVLYMTDWPKPGSKVYIMEGEFDAITLGMCGFVGCACGGKYLSDTQIELLRGYKPILVFDADDAGLKALVDVGNALLEKGFGDIQYVRPPSVYKDWNKLLQKRNAQTVKAYIERFEKPYNIMTGDILLSNQI